MKFIPMIQKKLEQIKGNFKFIPVIISSGYFSKIRVNKWHRNKAVEDWHHTRFEPFSVSVFLIKSRTYSLIVIITVLNMHGLSMNHQFLIFKSISHITWLTILVIVKEMLRRPRMMLKRVIMKVTANESYQRDTRLIDKMMVQYLSQNTIDMNMIMKSHQMIKDRRKVHVNNWVHVVVTWVGLLSLLNWLVRQC